MKLFKSILKGKHRRSPPQDIPENPAEEGINLDSCQGPVESLSTDSLDGDKFHEEVEENEETEESMPFLNGDDELLPIVECHPTVMFPSPEACQIRTLMKRYDTDVSERYEGLCDSNPCVGSLLVELIEQCKVFEESALICHGQQQNMSQIVEYVQRCIEVYRPLIGEDQEAEGEKIGKWIKKIIKSLQVLEGIARAYAEPGWVYRLAIDTGLTGRLENTVQEVRDSFVKLGLLDVKEPNLENVHKFLLKHLKGLGKGSWSLGLIALRENPEALENLANHLKISQSAMIAESYFNMNLPWGLMTITWNDARRDESKAVFQEYSDSVDEDGKTSLLSARGFEKYWNDSHDYNENLIEESSKLFVRLDSDFDGHLTASDFEAVYLQKGISAASSLVRLLCGLSGEKKMRLVFESFAVFGMGSHNTGSSKALSLDSARFAKLCRDSNMVSKPKQVKELDIVFSKCVPQNSKRMDFEHFLASISGMSVALCLSMSEICKRIITCTGPSSRCTKSSYVKLHDDKSLFTGVYARGGPDVGPVNVDMKTFVGRIKPKERVETPESLEITLPESPTMATTSRITSPGSRTPGRGASLEAWEIRKSREMASDSRSTRKSPGSDVAFGRGNKASPPKNGVKSHARQKLSLDTTKDSIGSPRYTEESKADSFQGIPIVANAETSTAIF